MQYFSSLVPHQYVMMSSGLKDSISYRRVLAAHLTNLFNDKVGVPDDDSDGTSVSSFDIIELLYNGKKTNSCSLSAAEVRAVKDLRRWMRQLTRKSRPADPIYVIHNLQTGRSLAVLRMPPMNDIQQWKRLSVA